MNRSESPNIVELAVYLQEAADRYTGLLALDHWKPGRSHMEQARNAFVSASNTLEQAHVVPREWFDELTAQNLSQNEHIRMLEEWIYEIIFSWLVGDIKPEQISRGRSLIENPVTPADKS